MCVVHRRLTERVEPHDGVRAETGVAPVPGARGREEGDLTPVLVMIAGAFKVKRGTIAKVKVNFSLSLRHRVGPAYSGEDLLCCVRNVMQGARVVCGSPLVRALLVYLGLRKQLIARDRELTDLSLIVP